LVGVLHILSQAFGALAFGLLAPTLVALVTGDEAFEAYLLVCGLTGFVSGAMYFALRGRDRRMGRAAAFGLATILWIAIPIVAAIPFALRTDLGYLQALFESVSGFTTSGGTVLRSISALGAAGIFWRAELQWLGGLATLVAFATIIARAGIGGLASRGFAAVGAFNRPGRDRVTESFRAIAVPYSLLTVLCFGLLVIAGLPTFDAACLALSTVSTGGFMPVDGSLAGYGKPAAEVVIAIFMTLGATSIVWQRMVLERRGALLLQHRETYWVLTVMLVAGLLYGWQFERGENLLAAIGEGLFNSISLLSTTGFETRPGSLSAAPDTLVLLLAIAGGAAISTGGGLKFYRIGGMIVQSVHELRRLVFPHSVRNTRFGSQPYDLALMKALWVNMALSLAVIAVAALLLSLSLPSFDGAVVAAIASFSNIGPLYSTHWGIGPDWPAYSDFGAFGQCVVIATMILGRIEVIVLFAALSAAYWRR
jgi:trk system potassium uptake protein TrkH